MLLAPFILFVCATQSYRLVKRSQVRHEINAIHKGGYPATERELIAWLPAVDDRQNAALPIVEAADSLSLPNDGLHWSRTEKLDPNAVQDLAGILTNNAPALELIRAAARLGQARFPVNYEAGPGALFPHLAKLKSLTLFLQAESVLESEQGRLDQAVQDIVDAVALARSLDKEPVLISQLVRIACLSITCNSLERLLTQHTLSDAQLNVLAQSIHGACEASHAAYAQGFVGELCLASFCYHAPPKLLADVLQNGSGAGEFSIAELALPLYTWSGLRDRDFLFYLRMMHRMLDAAHTPFPEGLAQSRAVTAQVQQGLQHDRLLVLARMLLPSLEKSIDKAAQMEGRLRSAETALAIERYRLQHQGKLPTDLAQLVPAFLAAVPQDPVDGAPLRYHSLSPGFVVYSVGPDGVDNGGVEPGIRSGPPGNQQPRPINRAIGPTDVTFIVER
jgi:hypothetical protein